jgi:hypothetical protein
MKKLEQRMVLSIFLIAFANFCFAQTSEALNPPLNLFNGAVYATTLDASNNVYAAGDFKNSGQDDRQAN